jgi:CDP-diacylglycerol--glycerol-3-phosphate 3-phosphatidyltransferase
MPAGRGGKAKTVAQSLAILIYIAPLPDPVQPVAKVAMGVAVALTVVTGLDYMFQAYRMREGSERTRLKRAARRALRRPGSGPAGAAVDLVGAADSGTETTDTNAVGKEDETGRIGPKPADQDPSVGRDTVR